MPSNPIPKGLRSAEFWYPVFFFVVGVVACWKLNPAKAPILLDDQVYFYISERAASGIPPHISEFDPKNALSMFATAFFICLGRLFDTDDLMAARFASILAVGASSALMWICARRIGGSRAMAHIAAAFPLVFVDFLGLAVAGAQPKVFLALAILLWLFAATTRRPFFLGATAVCCFLVWQPALLMVGISPVAMLAAGERRIRSYASLVAGVLLPLGLYELYFWWHNALDEQIYQSLVFAAVHRKAPPDFFGTFRRVFGVTDGNIPRRLAMFVFCAALVALPVSIVTAPRRTWAWLEKRADRICLVLGAFASTAFCFVDYQGFPDRFFVLPFVAVVDGIVLGRALLWVQQRTLTLVPSRARQAAPWKHVVPLAIVTVMLFLLPGRTYDSGGLKSQRAAATFVGSLLDRGKTVYVMSPLHLLAMNRASNFNSFGFFPIRIRAYLAERIRNEGRLLPLKNGKLPDVLIQTRMDFPPNQRWIDHYYRKENSKVLKKQKITMMVLRGDVTPPPPTAKAF